MNLLNKIIILFVIIICIKVIYNFYYFLLAKWFLKKYKYYIEENRKDFYISNNRQRIVQLFKKSNIKDTHRSHVESLGLGYVGTSSISLFENISGLREDIVNLVFANLQEACSVFRSRILESFNPVYWGELIIFLPKNILVYLGVKPEKIIIKIFQIFYWIIGVISVVIKIFLNNEPTDWINNLIK